MDTQKPKSNKIEAKITPWSPLFPPRIDSFLHFSTLTAKNPPKGLKFLQNHPKTTAANY